jgi:hypothetical protein
MGTTRPPLNSAAAVRHNTEIQMAGTIPSLIHRHELPRLSPSSQGAMRSHFEFTPLPLRL